MDHINSKKILVLGAGNFGTCLAQHLAHQGRQVVLWTRHAEISQAINQTNKNPKHLGTITLSDRISATHKMDEPLLSACSTIFLVTPTQALREVLGRIKPLLSKDLLIICAAKGIEIDTLKLPLQLITEILGTETGGRAVFLSGPSFASEVMERQPTAVAAASIDPSAAQKAQSLLHAPHFRVYTSNDPVGLEVAGALKNVVAIAAGAARGIGYQSNSMAALVTRGMAEISRIGVALGANPLTFSGLGGIGDLFLTCTSEKSRNYSVGFHLGSGHSFQDSIQMIGSTAEGVTTAKAAFQLSEKLAVDCPIITEVYRVLYEQKPIKQAVNDLLSREPRHELDLPTAKRPM